MTSKYWKLSWKSQRYSRLFTFVVLFQVSTNVILRMQVVVSRYRDALLHTSFYFNSLPYLMRTEFNCKPRGRF